MNPTSPPDSPESEYPAIGATLAELLALAVSAQPPETLWDDVRLRSVGTRPTMAGPPLGAADATDPLTGHAQAVSELVALADTIEASQWDVGAVHGWTVKGLFAHVAASERWFAWSAGLSDDPSAAAQFGPEPTDHIGFTAPAMVELLRLRPNEIVADLRAHAAAITGALRGLALADWDRLFRFYAFEGPMGANVIARTFELWTHQEDVLRALGRPLRAPDAGRLRMMSTVATAMLPAGMQLAGLSVADRSARIVLTGPGGGTFVSMLDPHLTVGTAATHTLLIADVVDFCRVVARRLPIDELDMVVQGDHALAHDLLVGASMLAAD